MSSLTNFLTSLLFLITPYFLTIDVSSLHINSPHNQGIDDCRGFLDTRTDKQIPTETLCNLKRIILTMNNFTFNQQHYLLIHGIFITWTEGLYHLKMFVDVSQ